MEPALIDVAAATTAVIGAVVPRQELVNFFDRSFSSVAAVVSDQDIAIESPAFARYHRPPAEDVDLEVGFVTARAVRPVGEVRAGSLPGGRVARLVHQGGYDQLGASWGRLGSWIDAQGLTPGRVIPMPPAPHSQGVGSTPATSACGTRTATSSSSTG